MKMKRIFSGALALALILTLTARRLPAGRAAFCDVEDEAVLTDAEVLRMLGVTAGTGNDRFSPDDVLTRAQLCTMAIAMLGRKGAVGQYQTYTIFPDVRAGHWATGYINMAVRGEDKLIAGFPDGTFHPDEPVTFAQTVTILMHMLGYQDADVGAAWPDGYLASAASIGLTRDWTPAADSTMTRARTARLLCRMLTTPIKGGADPFVTRLGKLVPGVLLLRVDDVAADGTPNAVTVQDGAVYSVADRPVDGIFAGRRGTLVLNDEGKVRTLLPDERGTQQTLQVEEALADGVVDREGVKHPLHSNDAVYWQEEKTTWAEMFFELRRGTALTIYYDAAGRLEFMVAGNAPTEDQEAVVVTRNGSTAGFERLTDRQDYAIWKNGTPVTAADLRQYDVATYDAASNIVRVCDVKLCGCYTDARPNLESPSKIGMLGLELDVLPGAAGMLAEFRLGRRITLLLTEDNRVAGAMEASKVAGNAMGIAADVGTKTASVKLFCGLTVKGDPNLRDTAINDYEGQLVSVTSYERGDRIYLTKAERGPNRLGALDVQGRKVGDIPLSDGVRVFDRVGTSPLKEVKLADLAVNTLDSARVLYIHTDYAGRIDLLVLDNATGEPYTYGILRFVSAKFEDGVRTRQAGVRVEYGEGLSTEEAETTNGYYNGEFGGIAFFVNSTGLHVSAAASMTKLEGVTRAAWNSAESVTWQGMTYAVAENAVCYNRATARWITLSEARAFTGKADLYVDDVGQKIRIVAVGEEPKL